jgi:hypothetical protein
LPDEVNVTDEREREDLVPDYVLIPVLLCVLCIVLTALIYWGGFVEERRNSRRSV